VARAAIPGRLIWQLARVRERIAESPTARTLVLDVPDWGGHRAGQHIDVRLTAEDGYQAQRSFSIASAPESDVLALTIERIDDGEVSPYLAGEVRAGDEVELRGPIGGPFTWSVDDGGPLLLVAGGSGLVPLMSMLRHRAARNSTIDTRVLISVRRPEDAFYRDELLALRAGDNLGVRWTYTRSPTPEPGGWTGRVNAAMLDELGPPADAAPLAFVCGPTGFVEHGAGLLVAAGHDPQRIRTERFGPT
jgi:ferredoxin-NADP reductase